MPAAENLPSDCRALVPLQSAPVSESNHVPTRRVAAFLAHLIATNRRLPQTRQRGCAEPAEAMAAYRAAFARTHPRAQ